MRRLFLPMLVAAAAGLPGLASAQSGDAAAGQRVFNQCRACHTADQGGRNGVGPNLFGIVGRKAGSIEGFRYSANLRSLAEGGLVWSEDRLRAYDGYLDAVFTTHDANRNMAVFRNRGDGTFEDRTPAAGVDGQLGGLFCVQTDYDNDGRPDLWVSRGAWLPHPIRPSLLRNKGGGTFEAFQKLPHCVDIITNLNDSISRMFMAITAELDRRQRILLDAKVNSIVEYRRRGLHEKGDGSELPFLFIVIDEFAEIMLSDRATATVFEQRVQQATQTGRSVMVHVVLATQRPDARVVRGGIKANLDARIALRLPTHHDSMTILGHGGAERLLGRGDLIFQAAGGPALRLQGYQT